jgi:glycosyltransferase involved in cell wall biosynthesis
MPTEKPRVLHVIARYNIGGTARYLNNLLPKLASDVDALLAVGHVQGNEIEDSSLEELEFVRIENLGRRVELIDDFRAYLQLRKVVKNFKPQIIHSHTFKAGVLSRLMFFKTPKVHTFHGHLMSDPEFSRRALQVIVNIERRLAKLTKRIITVGEQVTTDLLNVGVGKKSQYISIASEGVKLTFLTREEARRLIYFDNDVPVVLWMARMAPVKNPGLALEVARLLPEVNFLMAGGGDLFAGTKAEAPKNVLMLGWVDAAEVIPAADIFLSTSLNEGVPYSLIEVQSCGIPIVAVDSGAINELITDGVSGVLSKPEPSELALKLKSLLNDKSRRESIGMVARAQRESISDNPLMVDTHKELYKKFYAN